MLKNIEKVNLSVVEEDTYYQPNVIRLQPMSRENIARNVYNVPVADEFKKVSDFDNIEDKVESATIVNNSEYLAETSTANLYFIDESVVEETAYKPINLPERMMNNVYKKSVELRQLHDNLLVSNLNSESDLSEVVDENVLDDYANGNIVSAVNESTNNEIFMTNTSSFDDNFNENTRLEDENISENNTLENGDSDDNYNLHDRTLKSTDDVDYENATARFMEIVKEEAQTESSLMTSKLELESANRELNDLKEEQSREIVKQYELEKAVEEQVNRQQEILKKQAEKISSNIFELKKEKVNTDMQLEQARSDIENTNIDLKVIRDKNADLLSIYNSIMNSYEVSEEDNTKKIV